MIRTMIKVGAGIFFAVFAARSIGNVAKDLSRYNTMREMSGDGPLGPSQFKDAIKPRPAPGPGAAKGPGPLATVFGLVGSLPSDLSRYLKLRSM